MTELRLGVLSAATLSPRARQRLELAADAGLDHVGSIDHVCFHGSQGVDGLITAALLAGAHPTLSLYIGVYLLPLRHPVAVARQLATLAAFAPGRLTFGVGIGGEDPHEFASCGVDVTTRGRRTDESLYLLRRLLAGELVSFNGEFTGLDDTRILPTPSPPIPLVVGGRSDAAARRAGRLGDGWIGVFNSPARYQAVVDLVEYEAAAAKRSVPEWRHAMEIWCSFGADQERAHRRLAVIMERFYGLPFAPFERYCPIGTPERVAEAIAPYLEAGCRTFNLIPVAASVEEAITNAGRVRSLLAAGHTPITSTGT
jgi:alkanesulfonate monooxygenase SsuD/methylene tetrahydromethanopterin reductase-like flavin-dependent oxidoreductase (luciferase family)